MSDSVLPSVVTPAHAVPVGGGPRGRHAWPGVVGWVLMVSVAEIGLVAAAVVLTAMVAFHVASDPAAPAAARAEQRVDLSVADEFDPGRGPVTAPAPSAAVSPGDPARDGE